MIDTSPRRYCRQVRASSPAPRHGCQVPVAYPQMWALQSGCGIGPNHCPYAARCWTGVADREASSKGAALWARAVARRQV